MSAAQLAVTTAMGGQCFAVEPEVRPCNQARGRRASATAPIVTAGAPNCCTAVQFRG
jgi:hypothetical protein